MSEMPAENKQTKMEVKSLFHIITPILIGAVSDVSHQPIKVVATKHEPLILSS